MNKKIENPCLKCYLKGICDDDECGRKLYPLFVNKKPKFKMVIT